MNLELEWHVDPNLSWKGAASCRFLEASSSLSDQLQPKTYACCCFHFELVAFIRLASCLSTIGGWETQPCHALICFCRCGFQQKTLMQSPYPFVLGNWRDFFPPGFCHVLLQPAIIFTLCSVIRKMSFYDKLAFKLTWRVFLYSLQC